MTYLLEHQCERKTCHESSCWELFGSPLIERVELMHEKKRHTSREQICSNYEEGPMRPRSYLVGLMLASMLAGCSGTEPMVGSSEVGTRGLSQVQGPTPGQPGVPGQSNLQAPGFPQKFDVRGPEADSFGFAVTQPGPIIVDVQAQGAPVIVTLQSQGGQPITQQATGNLRLNYNVTPQDIQRSLFWGVQIRLAQAISPQAEGRASGSVNVQYPPVNQAAVQQAVQGLAAQQKQSPAQERQQAAAQAAAQLEQTFQQRKAQFEQQQVQRRAALMAPLQSILAQRQAQMGGAVRPRGVEEIPSSETGSAPGEDVASRGLSSGIIMINPTIVMPSSVIASLSVTQGQPGDPVMINGSGFGTSGGEVHFILGPNTDVLYQGQTWWYDNQILVNVPDVTGLMPYNGQIYVVRNPDKAKTPLASFHFEPAQEYRSINYTQDRQIGSPGYDWRTGGGYEQIEHENGNPFWGYKGNDVFFTNTRLKNNWVLDDVYLTPLILRSGGAYIQQKNVGTNWPYFNIRFWVDGCFGQTSGSKSEYMYLVSIRGPKGVPDGVAVP